MLDGVRPLTLKMNRTIIVSAAVFLAFSGLIHTSAALGQVDAGQASAPMAAPATGEPAVSGAGRRAGGGRAVGAGFLCIGDAGERAAVAVGSGVEEYSGGSGQDAH